MEYTCCGTNNLTKVTIRQVFDFLRAYNFRSLPRFDEFFLGGNRDLLDHSALNSHVEIDHLGLSGINRYTVKVEICVTDEITSKVVHPRINWVDVILSIEICRSCCNDNILVFYDYRSKWNDFAGALILDRSLDRTGTCLTVAERYSKDHNKREYSFDHKYWLYFWVISP